MPRTKVLLQHGELLALFLDFAFQFPAIRMQRIATQFAFFRFELPFQFREIIGGKGPEVFLILGHRPFDMNLAGSSIEDLAKVTGWQTHSIRGAMAGALRKKGHGVTSDKVDGVRRYRLVEPSNG